MIPKRLLDGEGTEIERLLLASGRAARPSAGPKWRTGIVFFLMGIGTVSKAHAVALLGAKARAWTIAQWLALGVGTGAAGWVAVHATTEVPDPVVAVAAPAPRRIPTAPSSRDDSSHIEPRTEPAAPQINAVEAPAPVEQRTPPPASPAVARTKRGAAPAIATRAVEPVAPERSIASEVEELDRARESLGMADPKRAVERLNRYDRLHPQGKLREEALRLRIEAAISAGERASARSLAQRFQALYPDSAHSERLKALVREQ
jgi:hypothetical protein